jgi:hypothetical protein
MTSKSLEQLSTNYPKKINLRYFSILFNYLTKKNLVLLELIMPDLIKNLPKEIKKNKLKTGIFVGLSAYWGLILIGTLTQFN